MNDLESKIDKMPSKGKIIGIMARNVGSDIYTATKKGLRIAAYIATSPLVGQMNDAAMERIYGKDSEGLIFFSSIVGIVAEFFAGGKLLEIGLNDGVDYSYTAMAGAVLIADTMMRGLYKLHNGEENHSSVIGLIPSAMINYFANVYENAKRGEK